MVPVGTDVGVTPPEGFAAESGDEPGCSGNDVGGRPDGVNGFVEGGGACEPCCCVGVAEIVGGGGLVAVTEGVGVLDAVGTDGVDDTVREAVAETVVDGGAVDDGGVGAVDVDAVAEDGPGFTVPALVGGGGAVEAALAVALGVPITGRTRMMTLGRVGGSGSGGAIVGPGLGTGWQPAAKIRCPVGQFCPANPLNGGMMSPHPGCGKTGPV